MNSKLKKFGKVLAIAAAPATCLGVSIWGSVHNAQIRDEVLEKFKQSGTFALYQIEAQNHANALKQEVDELQLKYDNGEITEITLVANKQNEYEDYVAYSQSNQYAIDCLLKNDDSVYKQNYTNADILKFISIIWGSLGACATFGIGMGVLMATKESNEGTSVIYDNSYSGEY